MDLVNIEYQEHGKFNAEALRFLMDLSGIKYDSKLVSSFGYGKLTYSHGVKMTWKGQDFSHPAIFARLIAKELGLACENSNIVMAEVCPTTMQKKAWVLAKKQLAPTVFVFRKRFMSFR